MLDQLFNIGKEAALKAGKFIVDSQEQARTSIKMGPLGEELVTQVDRQTQDLIIEIITNQFPDHGFIGEEGEQGKIFKQPPQGDSKVWWIIDPIDGTNNFARNLDLYAVSIAAMIDGHPVVGIIYDPNTDNLFAGIQGRPATINDRPMQVSDDEMSIFTSVGLDCHYGKTLPTWMQEIMQRCRFRNLGTAAMHMAYVCRGAMVGSVICMPKLWDIAAGAIIAEGSGAIVTNWEGKPLWPLDLEAYTGNRVPCVVANPKTHQEIMGILNS